MSHLLGGFFKYLAALLIFVFSVSLSYTFFSSIAPPNMPWFTGAALGLTEFGLICWLAVFMLQKHHDAHKTLAFIMIFVCVIAVVFTDAIELARQFGTTFFLSSVYYYGLIVVFCAHLLALIVDFFIGYFAVNSFHGHSPTPNPQPKNVQDTGETERPLEQASFAQTAKVKLPTLPFMSRMKAAIEAFRATGNQQQTQNQPVQPEQQEPEQEATQSQSE